MGQGRTSTPLSLRTLTSFQWGGALELYPVLAADSENPDRPNVPTPKPSVSIPASSSSCSPDDVLIGPC